MYLIPFKILGSAHDKFDVLIRPLNFRLSNIKTCEINTLDWCMSEVICVTSDVS